MPSRVNTGFSCSLAKEKGNEVFNLLHLLRIYCEISRYLCQLSKFFGELGFFIPHLPDSLLAYQFERRCEVNACYSLNEQQGFRLGFTKICEYGVNWNVSVMFALELTYP